MIRKGNELAHYSCVLPKYRRFPFMQSTDVQICGTWTEPAHRGQGLATCAIAAIVEEYASPSTDIWYFAHEENSASLKVVERSGFRRVGVGDRTMPLGIRMLGRYVVNTWFAEPLNGVPHGLPHAGGTNGSSEAPKDQSSMLARLARAVEAQGTPVVANETGHWMVHHRALLALEAMPSYRWISFPDAIRLMAATRSVMIRYQTNPTNRQTLWWHMVCRDYDFQRLSPNVRSHVRRGQKRHEIKELSVQQMRSLGYPCHVAAYDRYSNAKPMTPEAFNTFITNWLASGIAKVWGAIDESGALAGYILCVEEPQGVFTHTIDITPRGLKNYASAALFDHLLTYYVVERGRPVCNGMRSVNHQTNMQDFLLRLGFEREYSKLHVRYLPPLGVAVRLLYPLRPVIAAAAKRIASLHPLNALLFQESIAREEYVTDSLYLSYGKTAFDRVVGVGGCLALCLPAGLIALAIRIIDGPGVLFAQTRIGQHGRPFQTLKFRTMSPSNEGGSTVTVLGDKRVTQLGKWLRRWKLDELPQLLHVARGQMSFVGPRPDVPGYADRLSGDDREILALKPGITGPATLAFRDEERLLAQQQDPISYNRDVIYPKKVELNRAYLRSASFVEDLRCILDTIFSASGARADSASASATVPESAKRKANIFAGVTRTD